MPSMEMNLSVIASLRKRDHARKARENLVEQHADDADQENRHDDIGDREVIPLVPDKVADAGAADQHLGGDDHEPGNADRDPHAREYRLIVPRQDPGASAP